MLRNIDTKTFSRDGVYNIIWKVTACQFLGNRFYCVAFARMPLATSLYPTPSVSLFENS
jgi:hypothetical protein